MARGRKAAAVEIGPIEGPWELPEGWRWRRLSDAMPLEYGKALSAKERDATGGVPVFGSSGQVGRHSQALTAGPTVVVGRKGSAGSVHYSALPCWPIDTAFFAVPADDVDLRYGYWLLQHLRLDQLDQSTAIPSLSRDTYFDIVGPFPAREAQRQIAARVDQLFDEIDQGEAAVADAHSATATYRQALLRAAVTGELTADWRAENPAAENGQALVTRILAERRARWEADPKNVRKRYVELGRADADELSELPKTWGVAGFNVVADALSEGGKKLKESDYAASGTYPVVDQGAKLIAGYTNDAALLQEHTGPLIVFGDHTRRFKFIDFPFCVGADGVKLIAPHPRMDARYLHLALTAAHFEDRGYSRHFQFVRALDLPVPPFEEQALIVSRLTQAFDKLDGLEIAALHDQAADLRKSILAAAFRGDLVTEPQV